MRLFRFAAVALILAATVSSSGCCIFRKCCGSKHRDYCPTSYGPAVICPAPTSCTPTPVPQPERKYETQN